jgi:S-adenosylmethionine:tRNA ribosyltransferase-isomerase
MHPKNISIADFSYHLPQENIAFHPLAARDASKLLIYRDGRIQEDVYRHISNYIPEGSLLVFNNTKVVEARILFQKATGAQIELFCLEPPPEYPDITVAMMQQGSVRWKCLIGGASKWKPGQVLTKTIEPAAMPASQHETINRQEPVSRPEPSDQHISLTLEARYLEKAEGAFLIEFSWTPSHLTFAELLHRAGLIPLPPYIRRAAEEADQERYQTIYARHDGSVAAPTAGLHFSDNIFASLSQKHIRQEYVTLHVGAGTFMPVKAATMEGHTMHTEWISVERSTIVALLQAIGNIPAPAHQEPDLRDQARIIPVGTTSLRTIESLYWLGLKIIAGPSVAPEDLAVRQWDAYEWEEQTSSPRSISSVGAREALNALLDWMDRQGLTQLLSRTQLLITPGYRWKIAQALITNFHQPESTLLLLVAALIGEDWRKVYQYALDHQFRFLSYGDGSLLFPPSNQS